MGLERASHPDNSTQSWCDIALRVALAHKPGSHPRASTALRHLDSYLDRRRRSGLEWRFPELCRSGVALRPLSAHGSADIHHQLLHRVGSTLEQSMVGASVSPSVLEDFGRYLTDVARVPTLKSAKKYVGAVRSYAEAALGIRLPEATLFKSLATRDGQAPKPATKVVKQPCPKHLVAAVIQDSSVDMAVRLATVLMWFATLRMGELTNQLVAQFDPSFALLRRDVMVAANGSMACLRLRKSSQTRPTRARSASLQRLHQGQPSALCGSYRPSWTPRHITV